MILFGSMVRGEGDDESDVDILVITKKPLNRWERHEITDLVCEINLRYGSNLSTLVVDHKSWERGPVSFLPIKDEIEKEGMLL